MVLVRSTGHAALAVVYMCVCICRTAVEAAAVLSSETSEDEALCRNYTALHAKDTWRSPAGVLKFPYLVPAGPYEQEWDWDSFFLGTATLSWGSRAYLEGAMLNFFAATNVDNGSVTGCVTPKIPTVCSSDPKEHDALVHAKPLLIQGAWISASAPGGDVAVFRRYKAEMKALLSYWDRPPRKDFVTGLRVWHDQMESGADNCVLSKCPNARSTECWSESQAFTLASPDLMVFLNREHVAFANFLKAWSKLAQKDGNAKEAEKLRMEALHHTDVATELADILNRELWSPYDGFHVAHNVSSREYITARTYQIALPLWAGLVNKSQAASIIDVLSQPDMLSEIGIRSASSKDLRYSNANVIIPYSNWRGPMWVNVNALACYGLASYGYKALAMDIAGRVVKTLADDLRKSGKWHEAYSTDDGTALAAPGFLSWNTLSAELLSNLRLGRDPFRLEQIKFSESQNLNLEEEQVLI
eukprot:TRINITY_DN30477_c0_g1_i1.p1 TRINITY_DN30477_c0_g1~~TRINITY_DN30477_c0_g1_i1.p1  ORF type:complete len:472 (+),score=80.89 TRINITY_DN30477_c0_g1_i1:73-1488(+)